MTFTQMNAQLVVGSMHKTGLTGTAFVPLERMSKAENAFNSSFELLTFLYCTCVS